MDYTSESCERSCLLSPAALLMDSHLSFHPYICQSRRPPYLPFPPHACHFSFVSYIGSDSARRHLINIQLCAEREAWQVWLFLFVFFLNMTVMWDYKLHGNSIDAVKRQWFMIYFRNHISIGAASC